MQNGVLPTSTLLPNSGVAVGQAAAKTSADTSAPGTDGVVSPLVGTGETLNVVEELDEEELKKGIPETRERPSVAFEDDHQI